MGSVASAQADTRYLTSVSPGYPAAVDTGRGLAAFALGPRRHLHHRRQDGRGGTWSGFELVHDVALDCRPVAVTVPNGAIVVFARAGGELVHCWQDVYGGAWSGWHGLGAVTGTSEPSVVVGPTGRMAVFVRTTQGSVRYRTQSSEAGGWASWQDLGPAGRPSAVVSGAGGAVVFARSGSALVHRWQIGVDGEWSQGWSGLGGELDGDPSAVVTPTGAIAVVARYGKPLWIMAYANHVDGYVAADDLLWRGGYAAGWHGDDQVAGIGSAAISYSLPVPLRASPRDRPGAPDCTEGILTAAIGRVLLT